jgi:hypothetical protein
LGESKVLGHVFDSSECVSEMKDALMEFDGRF